jgi:hypothetical protein
MPLAHRIDHRRRLGLTRATGTLTGPEIFAYQREVWSRPDVAGYDELVDMTDGQHVAFESVERITALASVSASTDARSPSPRFAIVAPRDFEFALGRMVRRPPGAREPEHQAGGRLSLAAGGPGVARSGERAKGRALSATAPGARPGA